MRTVLVVAALLFGASCKRDSSGLPPADDWSQHPGGGDPNTAPPLPESAPQAERSNPHGGAQGEMPNDSIHAGLGGGGGGGDDDGDDQNQQLPPGHPAMSANDLAQKTAPRSLEKLADGRYVLGPFTAAIPADWTLEPVTAKSRAADIFLSKKPGEEVEMVVTYFGPGGAGNLTSNIDRWASQVTQPDGKPSKDVAQIETIKVAGQDASFVAISGHLRAEDMAKQTNIDITDATFINVIVPSSDGPYYFKLYGAKKAVDPLVGKVKAFFESFKLKT